MCENGKPKSAVFYCLDCGQAIYRRTFTVDQITDLRIAGITQKVRVTKETQGGHSPQCTYTQAKYREVRMGAFDKDKTLGRGTPLYQLYEVDREFVLHAVDYVGEIEIPNSQLGATDKCVLTVSPLEDVSATQEASVIGASGTKLKDVEDDELPAVCKLVTFHSSTYDSDGTIVQWQREWTKEEQERVATPL